MQLELHCVLHALEFEFYNLPLASECWCDFFGHDVVRSSIQFFFFVCVLCAMVKTSFPKQDRICVLSMF